MCPMVWYTFPPHLNVPSFSCVTSMTRVDHLTKSIAFCLFRGLQHSKTFFSWKIFLSLKLSLVNHGNILFTHWFCPYVRLSLNIWHFIFLSRAWTLVLMWTFRRKLNRSERNWNLDGNGISFLHNHVEGTPFSFCHLWRYKCLALGQSCAVESHWVLKLVLLTS